MKKTFSTILLLMLILSLGSCELAVESDLPKGKDESPYEVPFAIKMDIHEEPYASLDLTEYLYVSFVCEGQYVQKDRTCSQYGKSVIGTFDLHVHSEHEDDELLNMTYTYTFDTSVYVGRDLASKTVHLAVLYEDLITHEIYERPSLGSDIGGAQITLTQTGTYSDQTIAELIVSVEFILVDDLLAVSFRQYDEHNDLLQTDVIAEESDVKTIKAHEHMAYMLVEETYRDQDDELYIERTLIEESEHVDQEFFHLKFLNDLDLVENDYVEIDFNRED
jgi:hypothetical protein